MSTALTTLTEPEQAGAVMERVVIQGDLSKLAPADRVTYYNTVCQSLGLNPFTRPFEYIQLNGKLTLYAKKDATEQLRKINGVSIERLERESMEGCYIVTAYARERTGRIDSSIGAVSIQGVKGDSLANAMMKAETKAKRRVTLSICGLGMLDETEIETIAEAEPLPPRTAATPREVLKPSPAPQIHAATVQVMPQSTEGDIEREEFLRGEPLPLRQEQVEQLEADPLPDLQSRQTEETPEEAEAERLALVEKLRLTIETLGYTPDQWQSYLVTKDVHSQTRGWLRTKIEVAEKEIARRESLPDNPLPYATQTADGKQKKLRKNAKGETVAVMEAAPKAEPKSAAFDRFHALFEQHRANGQEYAAVRAKVESVVHAKNFKNFGELDHADLARATSALKNWNPDADANITRKEAKK